MSAKQNADAANVGAHKWKNKLLANCTRAVAKLQDSFQGRGGEVPGATSVSESQRPASKNRSAITYQYRDADGTLLYEVVRSPVPKGFKQRRPDGRGGWIWNLNGTKRVLYRLPELLKAEASCPVFIVEGEKDADRLAAPGLVATTNPGGAGKWRDEYNEPLRGRHVVVLPDNDEPGKKHASQVAASLQHIAASVKIVELPSLPPKGDVSDWLDYGRTVNELETITKAASVWELKRDQSSLGVVCMADVEREEIKWLWHPILARKKVIVLTGEEGVGKTWLMCAVAAAISRGASIPNVGEFEQGNVLMFTTEDGLADTFRPRLEDCGADLTRVFACDEVFTLNEDGLLRLEEEIVKHRPALITIDPFFSYVGGKANINQDNVLRSFIAPLKSLAERYDCTIVIVRHLNKAKGLGESRAAGLAGIGVRASARLELFAGKNPDDENDRALIVDKSNLAASGAAVGYKIENNQFSWKDSTTLTVKRILACVSDEDDRADHAEAVAALRDLLGDGERPAEEVQREMKQAGFSNYATRKAQRQLHIKPRKTGGEFGGKGAKWIWELPPQDVEAEDFQNLVISGGDNGTYTNDLTQDVEPREKSASCEENIDSR